MNIPWDEESELVGGGHLSGLVRKMTLLRPPRIRAKLERHFRATGRLEPQDLAPRAAEALGWLRSNGSTQAPHQ